MKPSDVNGPDEIYIQQTCTDVIYNKIKSTTIFSQGVNYTCYYSKCFWDDSLIECNINSPLCDFDKDVIYWSNGSKYIFLLSMGFFLIVCFVGSMIGLVYVYIFYIL